ncbi:MAG TPA: ornithine acetyltransferase, partial [Candidatus Omnitrophica bacterium]|nr:ornithine acetyltransferase [Candidatus Omnitrophota bacterium]
EAKKAALAIANSNLFKTAVYGGGTNWGRIIAAIGASGITVKSKVTLSCSSFKKRHVMVKVDLACGAGKAVVYTSDLTPEYVKINAEYN